MTDKNTNTDLVSTSENLPAVIDSTIFLVDSSLATIAVVLSERFNELRDMQCINPDYGLLDDLKCQVEQKKWKADSRQTVDRINQGEPCLSPTFRDKADFDPILRAGAVATIIPIIEKIEQDMEDQLETEIADMQQIAAKRKKPKAP